MNRNNSSSAAVFVVIIVAVVLLVVPLLLCGGFFFIGFSNTQMAAPPTVAPIAVPATPQPPTPVQVQPIESAEPDDSDSVPEIDAGENGIDPVTSDSENDDTANEAEVEP